MITRADRARPRRPAEQDAPAREGCEGAATPGTDPPGAPAPRWRAGERDPKLDRLVEIVADVFAVPIVLVSVSGADGQCIRAARGTGLSRVAGELAPDDERPEGDGLTVVPDTRPGPAGARRSGLAAWQDIRAYALAPLRGPAGQRAGVLYIGDHRPRRLDAAERSRLLQFRDLVELLLADQPGPADAPGGPAAGLQDRATGLPGRELAIDRLEQAVLRAGDRDRRVIVAVVGVRRMGSVLGVLDRSQADQALAETQLFTELGRRLRALLPVQCTVARIRREQFVVVVPAVRRRSDVARLVRRYLERFPREFRLGGFAVRLLPRVGVSVFPDHGDTPETLLARATAALPAEQAEGERDGLLQVYSPGAGEGLRQRVRIESLLRGAMDSDALRLAYQPKIDMRTGRVAGMEALLRWHDGELGELSPAQTVAAAQRADLMLALTDWVLRNACRQVREWEGSGLPPVPVAVNLTRDELGDPDFARRVMRTVAEAGLDPGRLELEVTEGSLIRDLEVSVANIRALRDEGVRFSVDDFGKGYSWFDYLRLLPVDAVKIDRSFVSRLASEESDAAVVQAIIALARGLGMQVIAEGVETRDQLTYLKAYRCDHVQGYWFAAPMEAGDAARLLAGEPVFSL